MQKSKESRFREECWAELLENGRNWGRRRFNQKISVKRCAFCVFQSDFTFFMSDWREGRNCVISAVLESLGLIVTRKFPPSHKTRKLVRGTVHPATACMYCKVQRKGPFPAAVQDLRRCLPVFTLQDRSSISKSLRPSRLKIILEGLAQVRPAKWKQASEWGRASDWKTGFGISFSLSSTFKRWCHLR